jgi:hypothetical protein
MTLQPLKRNYFHNILKYAFANRVNKECISIMRRYITQNMCIHLKHMHKSDASKENYLLSAR